MKLLREYIQGVLHEQFEVRGYIKPESSFFLLSEWEDFVNQMLELQELGMDTRGGEIAGEEVEDLVRRYFSYQLDVEVPRYELLTRKNVLDFVEDFVNHRFWSFQEDYSRFFPDINALRFGFFYSRGDLEPFVLLDDAYTIQMYGSLDNVKELMHYTSPEGLENIERAISEGREFDISTFTVAKRPYFDAESSLVVRLLGNVRAAFRSDVKSTAVDSGRRACSLLRLEYPGRDLNNICYELDTCDGSVRTSLWNEYIATPIEILGVEEL
jgi:hypothetical protein